MLGIYKEGETPSLVRCLYGYDYRIRTNISSRSFNSRFIGGNMITKEELIRAFERNNEFIKAEKRRELIHKKRQERQQINDFKIDVVCKAKKKRNNATRGASNGY